METLKASLMPSLPQVGKLESSPPCKSDSTDLDFKKKETEHLKKEAKKSEEVSKTQSDKEVGEEDIGEDRVNDAKGLLPGGDLLQEEPDVLARHHILQLNLVVDRG